MTNQDPLDGEVPTWTLGWRLRRSLDWANIGVQEMADIIGYSRSQISRWLNDRGEPPRMIVLRQWAMRCNVPLPWLITGDVDLTAQDSRKWKWIMATSPIGFRARDLVAA